jgi:hypothetical protein
MSNETLLHDLLFRSTEVNHRNNVDKTSLTKNNMMTNDDQLVTEQLTFEKDFCLLCSLLASAA